MRSLVLLLVLAVPLSAQDPAGLWGAETLFGPQVRGAFTLERSSSAWTLRAGGFEVAAPLSGDELHIALPDGQGELRGTPHSPFWIQPRGNLGQYATPVTLEPIGANAWRGTLTPLDDRFSLYLWIARNEDGSLRGSFHNPEVNWNGRAAWFRVELKEESIALADPKTGKVRFVQPYDAKARTITMNFGAPFALTPRTRENAIGFAPRSSPAPYRYRAPLDLRDGWPVARARDVGLDEDLLRQFVQKILDVDPTDANAPRIHSLLVARHGRLVLDEYFFGFGPEHTHDLRSASKTFTSLMAGIAMDRNAAFTIDTPIANGSPITLAHLLTHSSGLACDDNDDASPGNENTMQNEAKDWYGYFAALPVVHPPGTTYAYCSGGINFAAGMVAKAMNAWLPEFFERTIARPLQFGEYHVNLMPDGQAYGGGGMYLRPRDFLKLGQLYLDGGTWKGKRIVSKKWVQSSTAHRITTSTGGSDGYAWHRYALRAGDRTYDEYEASGNGGQFAIVVPALDLVVVITAGNYGQYGVWRTFRDELVPRYVMGRHSYAVIGGAARGATPSPGHPGMGSLSCQKPYVSRTASDVNVMRAS